MLPDSFCVRPFTALEITSQGDFAPCCDYKRMYDGYNINTHSIDDVLNSKEVFELKEAFFRGEKPEKCGACWRNEANGLKSQRINSNHEYRRVLDEIDSPAYNRLQALDLKMGKTCNQMCVICDYGSSSMLREEDRIIFNKVVEHKDWTRDDESWRKIEERMHDITRIDVYGGEPWLLKGNWRLIDKLIASGKAQEIHINYATNGSILNDKILERLLKFKKCSLLFSADGTERAFEYNRYPGKWDVFEQHLNTMKDFQKNIHFFAIAYTVSMYSVFNLRKSLEYYTDLGVKTWLNPVNQWWYDTRTLPQRYKDLVLEDLSGIGQVLTHGGDPSAIINNLNLPQRNPAHWTEFKRITRMRDELRNHNIVDFIPELEGWQDEN